MKNHAITFKTAERSTEKHATAFLKGFGKLRLLVLLSLFLFSGYVTEAQTLDCSNAIQFSVDATYTSFDYPGSTSGYSNNVSEYYVADVPFPIVSGLSGPEVVYKMNNWPGGQINIELSNLSSYLDIMVFDACDSRSVKHSKFGSGTADRKILTHLDAGTYYIVIDGVASGSFHLKVQYNNPPIPFPDYHVTNIEGPLSAEPGELVEVKATVRNDGLAIPTNTELADAKDGFSIVSTDGSVPFTGPILIKATESIGIGDETIVTGSFKVPDNLPSSSNYSMVFVTDRTNEFKEMGQYKNNKRYDFTILSGELSCNSPLPDLIPGRTYSGNTSTNGTNNVKTYCGNIKDQIGKEVVYKIENWSGGPFSAKLNIKTIPNSLGGPDFIPNLNMVLLANCATPGTCLGSSNKNNQATNDPKETIDIANLAAGNYYLVVDGEGTNLNSGEYTLTVTQPPAKPLKHLVKFSGNFDLTQDHVTNNTSSYGNGSIVGLTGREALFTIDLPKALWLGDNLYFDLKGQAERVILTQSLDPIVPLDGPNIINGTGKLLPGVPKGTYYVIVEGPTNGSDGNFDLTLRRDHLRCSDAKDIAPGQVEGPGTMAPYTYVNNYCGDPNSTPLKGSEAIFSLDWDGGAFKATLSDMQLVTSTGVPFGDWTDAALILLKNCEDPASCVKNPITNQLIPPVVNDGSLDKLVLNVPNLPAGDYTIVVDGKMNNGDFKLKIDAPQTTAKPDYIPRDLKLDDQTSLSVTPGQSVQATVFAKNQGDGAGGQRSAGKYYYSEDAQLSANDIALGTNDIEALSPNQETPETERITIPANAQLGTRYILYKVDADNEITESNENNNVISLAITVTGSQKPDYQPTDFQVRGGITNIQAGGTLVIDLNIKNNGPVNGQGNGGKDKYYFSTSSDLNGSSLFLRDFGTADINANSGFKVNSGPLEIPATTAPGTYYILFKHDADNKIDESNENNNIAFVQITVVAPDPNKDLSVDFSADKREVCEGESVALTAQVSGPSNIVSDFSGKGNDGIMRNFNGNSFQSRAGYGQALAFKANFKQFIDATATPGLPKNQEARTIEAWIKTSMATTLADGTDSIGNIVSWGVDERGQRNSIAVRRGHLAFIGNNLNFEGSKVINDDAWHHVAITFDGTTWTLYVDGDVDRVVSNANPETVGERLLIGKNVSGEETGQFFDGEMDELRIWTVSRTQAQIQANYNKELNGTEPDLLVYYNFNQEVAGASYSWSIDKDGQTVFTSSDANPSFSFTDAGTYRASLTVTANGRTYSKVKESYIKVNDCGDSFSVDFSADKTTPCVSESIQFTSSLTVDNPEQLSDRSGNGKHGALKNFRERPFGQFLGFGTTLNFDGTNDYVELPDNITSGLNQITIEARYYHSGNADWQRIFDFGSGEQKFMFLTPSSFSGSQNKPMFWITTNGYQNRQTLVGPSALPIGDWYHFAVVLDGDNDRGRLYINGQLVADETITLSPADLGDLDKNWLGRSQFSSDSYLGGGMDEVRIWRTARTEQQINANKDKELTGSEAGLVAYYDFNKHYPSQNTTYDWEFNGPTLLRSAEANPTITLTTPGTYDVTLTVRDGSKSKTVTKNSYITVKSCAPDWSVTKTGDNHTVIIGANANITLDGQPIAIGDYIGAFYNDNGTVKCAGKAQWTGQNIAMIVYGDDLTTDNAKEGFGVGESFQWKLWKASTSQELFGAASYATPDGSITHTGQFAVNGLSRIIGLIGTTQQPQTDTQTITLQPGWNLVSSYIIANASNMEAIFAPVKSSISIVKDGEGTAYIPMSNVNNIGNWNVLEGYQVRVLGNNPIQLTLTGEKVDLTRTSLSLSKYWNLMAYLKDTEQDIQIATAPITNEIDLIKDVDGGIYMPSLNINNIGNMKPGKGYWAKMKSAATLNYNARMATPPANMHTATLMPNQYRIKRTGTGNATIILDTKGLVAYGDEIGVFDTKGNLVGAVTYEDNLLAFSIWGDDASTDEIDGLEDGEEFEIRVWNKAEGTEKTFAFTANLDMYITHEVIQAELLRATNVPTLLEANSLKLYPNPTRDQATVSLTLTESATVEATVFDLSGRSMLSISQKQMTSGNHKLRIQAEQLPAGLYHCRVLIDGIVHNIPFSVVK